MKYDDASWHTGEGLPEGLAKENGATHIGIFLAWAFHRGLAGRLHTERMSARVEDVRQRRITGRDFLLASCNGQLTDKDLNAVGKAFAGAYYEAGYTADWETFVASRRYASSYHAPDTWETFEAMARVLDHRLQQWRDGARTWPPLPPAVLGPRRRWWMPW